MPANLTPDFKKAEQLLKEAKSDEERLKALELMLATIPKHKGTDKMQADIKRRIAKMKRESSKKKGAARHGYEYNVEKQGAAQVVMVGLGNSGKSSIVASVTNAEVFIADYPQSTIKPVPGMMPFEDIQIQLVDLPPVDFEAPGNWLANIIRYSDMLALILDISDEPALQMELIMEELDEWRIKFLKKGEQSPELSTAWFRPAIIIGNKMDRPGAPEYLSDFRSNFGDDFPIIGVSSHERQGLEEMKRTVFEALCLVRVYSKTPGKEADKSAPFILSQGSSLMDFAEKVHKDFAQKLNYARVWGSTVFEGQRVSREYIIQDKDIIELHM